MLSQFPPLEILPEIWDLFCYLNFQFGVQALREFWDFLRHPNFFGQNFCWILVLFVIHQIQGELELVLWFLKFGGILDIFFQPLLWKNA